MDSEERKLLESLGWTPDLLNALKRTPEIAAVDRMMLDRAQKGLSAVGYTALEVIAANPRISILETAKKIKIGASAIGLTMAVYQEAMEQGVVRQTAKELLIRKLVEQFPSGWTIEGDIHPLVRIDAWSSEVGNYTSNSIFGDHAERIISALAIDSPPPEGWIPQWPDDPLIDDLFDRWWPVKE